LHNVLIILTVILEPSILSTQRNLPLKSTTYENHIKNASPYWHVGAAGDVITLANKHHEY